MPKSTRQSEGELGRKVRAERKARNRAKLEARNELYVRQLRDSPTEAEVMVKTYLEHLGCDFVFQHGVLKPFHRIFDFYFPKIKSVLEVDGSSHAGKENKDYEKDRQILKAIGVRTYRITNAAVYRMGHRALIHDIFMGKATMAFHPMKGKGAKILPVLPEKKIRAIRKAKTQKEKMPRNNYRITKFVRKHTIKPMSAKWAGEETELMKAVKMFFPNARPL